MPIPKRILPYPLIGLACSALLVAGVAQAERERAPGYVTDLERHGRGPRQEQAGGSDRVW